MGEVVTDEVDLSFWANVATSGLDIFFAQRSLDLLGKFARDWDGVHAADEIFDALPARHPTVPRVHHGDHAVEIGARALEHSVPVALEVKKSLAVIASFLVELVQRLVESTHKLVLNKILRGGN